MTGCRNCFWGTVVGLIIFAGLIAGCCDECKTPVEPTNPILGSWECVRYMMDDTPQPGNIGQLMTFYSDGTGGVGTPDSLITQPFTWVSTEEKVYLEVEADYIRWYE
ncbi:MAG: hypothetical protein KAV42_11390 [Candidatus Krumholzibacteria bacterium]|nr:hypothetical protein [Candidatus Krumholzibacteria bacterium]